LFQINQDHTWRGGAVRDGVQAVFHLRQINHQRLDV
jgi:hypothetical protein